MTKLDRLFLPPEEEDTLYHYTSAQGLLGILRDRRIWASKIQYLNDSQELRLALELAREILEGQRSGDAQDWGVDEMLDQLKGIESINVCVVSFTTARDQLSQWRAYGGSHGYALGFRPASLTRAEWLRFQLMRCEYCAEEQKAIVEDLVKGRLRLERRVSAGEQVDAARRKHQFIDPLDSIGESILKIAPALKHESFREEQEWRLVSRPISASCLKFRPGSSTLVPYCECQLSGEDPEGAKVEAVLEEIVVGPCPDMDQAVSAVQQLLYSRSLKDCRVSRSSIPYRTW